MPDAEGGARKRMRGNHRRHHTSPPAARRAIAARVALLFDQHAGMVLGLCRLLLRDHHEAEDAAQQTFVSAYRSLLRGNEPRDDASWLAAIARNECRARIRKRMRAPVALDGVLETQLADSSDLAEIADRRAELAEITLALADLPIRQREAIALRDFLGLSYEEVASTLSVSVPVVESLLFRARRRLRDTVRTVPRYAAGLAALPLAFRAALSREPADLDAVGPVVGALGGAAAAIGAGVTKLVSLPFAAKAATAVAVVAASTAVPPLLDDPGVAPPPSAARAPAALGSGSDSSGQPAPQAAGTTEAPSQSAGAGASSKPTGADPGGVETPMPESGSVEAVGEIDAVEAQADPGRIGAAATGDGPALPLPDGAQDASSSGCDEAMAAGTPVKGWGESETAEAEPCDAAGAAEAAAAEQADAAGAPTPEADTGTEATVDPAASGEPATAESDEASDGGQSTEAGSTDTP